MAIEKNVCLECKEPIFGRSDKKFCNDSCRNSYNNKLNSDSSAYVRNINNALRKNRRLLEMLNPEGKAKVTKKKLLEKGFDFNYFTHLYKTQKGTVYYFCYDLGYLPIEGDYYILVKRNEHD